MSTTSIENLFNICELSCIEQINNYFHELTPNKTLHIANICSNLFARYIDEEMIKYVLSLYRNGFLPTFNPYLHLQKFLDTYASENNLYTLTRNVLLPIPGQFCLECGKSFSKLSSEPITIYQYDGTIENGLIMYYSCSHAGTMKSMQPARMQYPNFVTSSDGHIFTQSSFNNTEYLYFGGNSVFSKKLLLHFETLLVTSHANFQGFTQAYNLLHDYECRDLRFAERRIFSQVWIKFELISFAFFMGYEQIIMPSTMDRQQNDYFFYSIFQPFNELFTKFWLNHAEYKSCGLTCTRALVIDANQKLRRRICLDKTNTISTAEMLFITIGCDQTPLYGSLYCAAHLSQERTESLKNKNHCSSSQVPAPDDNNKLKLNEKNLRTKTILVAHEAISCSTLKKMPNQYIDKCMRSFGIIVYVTNCNVVVAFTEIFRSETIKEILNGLIAIVNISPSLPPSIIYDDACHLIRRLIDGQMKGEFKITPALLYLNQKTYNIDRMHITNHTDKWCRKHLDPKNNPLLKDINTESCEQLFSWTNGYATAFTSMNASRCRIMLLLTFHLRNCFLKKINPHIFNTGKTIVTKNRPLVI